MAQAFLFPGADNLNAMPGIKPPARGRVPKRKRPEYIETFEERSKTLRGIQNFLLSNEVLKNIEHPQAFADDLQTLTSLILRNPRGFEGKKAEDLLELTESVESQLNAALKKAGGKIMVGPGSRQTELSQDVLDRIYWGLRIPNLMRRGEMPV